MDYQSAQSAYDLALQEYQKLLGTGTGKGNTASAATFGFDRIGGGLSQYPSFRQNTGGGNANGAYLNDSRGRLDAARSALDAARASQQGSLQNQYGKLTGQASNALYGGILGYSPQPMVAEGGQSFAPPQGNLQQPFGNMQGILGQAQRPQFMSQGGGMADMMQPKLRMY